MKLVFIARRRWIYVVFLILPPLVLGCILANQRSWWPRTINLKAPIADLAFSPDGKTLISANVGSVGHDGLYLFYSYWNLASSQLEAIFPPASERPHRFSDGFPVVISANTTTIAAAVGHSKVMIWDARTKALKHIFDKPLARVDWISSLAFSRDGSLLAEGREGDNNTILLWDTRGKTLKRVFDLSYHLSPAALFFAADDKTLIGSDSCVVQIWNVANGKRITEFKHSPLFQSGVELSPDGRTIITAEQDGECGSPQIVFRNAHNGVIQRRIKISNIKGDWTHIDQFAISPDEATLAVCSNEVETGSSCGLANNAEYRGSGPFNGKVSLWSTETGHLLRILDHDAQPLGGMALSPDGTLLAAILGKNASDVVLWNVATGEQVRVLKSHQKPVTALCFSPDGRTLATGDETGIAKLWRIR